MTPDAVTSPPAISTASTWSGDLLRRLRHDFRTPINHLIGYGELLLERAEEQGWQEFGQGLVTVVKLANELLVRLNDALAADRFDGRPAAVARVRHELRLAVTQIIGECEILQAGMAEMTQAAGPSDLGDMEKLCQAGRRLLSDLELGLTESTESEPPAALGPAEPDLAPAEPLAAVPLTRSPARSPATASGPPTRLLVVDDNALNRDLLCRHLLAAGHGVETAENGADALARLKAGEFDLVLLDIQMPVMDGYQTLCCIRSDDVLCGIPVIMLTSLDGVTNVVRCVQAGADDYLTKPYNPILLRARIQACLDRRRAMQKANKLGRYRLEKMVGKGGMAEVYLASHAMLRRPTAIKVLRYPGRSEEAIACFQREVQLTSQLTHPNTIAIYDFGRTPEGAFYYAMEYLDGVNLQQLVQSEGPQSEARTCNILKQVCASLAEAHAHGLIHRDIKPANIMLCVRGGVYDFVKVLDFGIVKEQTDMEAQTPKSIQGTPAFISPEAVVAPATVDGRSDLYSLGCVAYYLLTGKHVFDIENMTACCYAHVRSPPPSLTKRRQRYFSSPLDRLIMQCLAKSKEDRPDDALALARALNTCRVSGHWTPEDMRIWWAAHAEATAQVRPGLGGTLMPAAQEMEIDFEALAKNMSASGPATLPLVSRT